MRPIHALLHKPPCHRSSGLFFMFMTKQQSHLLPCLSFSLIPRKSKDITQSKFQLLGEFSTLTSNDKWDTAYYAKPSAEYALFFFFFD